MSTAGLHIGTTVSTVEDARAPLKVCFVAPTTYPVLAADRSIPEVGGAQVQQTILAKAFARRGHPVSMISQDYGQPAGAIVNGVTVFPTYTPEAGLPGVRFVHPRMTSMWSAMGRADADVYYQRAAGSLSAIVVAFAKAHRKLSVYAAASDRDFLPETPHLPLARDRAMFRWAVRNADVVVAQTQAQREACLATFGREPILIRSCYDHRGEPARREGKIIWVGRTMPVKRPELFIELAKRLPQYEFKLVGGESADVQALTAQAAGVSNIEFTGFVPFADVEAHFDGASLLVNTSSNEGFPNTFLQSWSRGMPTVSFFDPREERDGRPVSSTVATMDEMVAKVHALKAAPDAWSDVSRLSTAHFEATFSVSETISSYIRSWRAASGSNRPTATVEA